MEALVEWLLLRLRKRRKRVKTIGENRRQKSRRTPKFWRETADDHQISMVCDGRQALGCTGTINDKKKMHATHKGESHTVHSIQACSLSSAQTYPPANSRNAYSMVEYTVTYRQPRINEEYNGRFLVGDPSVGRTREKLPRTISGLRIGLKPYPSSIYASHRSNRHQLGSLAGETDRNVMTTRVELFPRTWYFGDMGFAAASDVIADSDIYTKDPGRPPGVFIMFFVENLRPYSTLVVRLT